MIQRDFWVKKINEAWKSRSLVWLSGVRRSGKTTLCKMFPNAAFYNCDLPSVQRQLANPEFFFSNFSENDIIIFDEIHRIDDPSIVLKIASDEYPRLKILATGSSTLEATKKFRDTLTGRKTQIFLPPVLWNETCNEFEILSLDKRLLNGGLPELLITNVKNDEYYSEWVDSFYAKDIQVLFNVRNREGFLKLFNIIMLYSGGAMELTSLAKESGLTRPTVMNHLDALLMANAIYLVQPFYGGGVKEIVKRPKVYGFDTGFVTYVKGWNEIRETDRGILWEHLVLDMLRVQYNKVYFWMDNQYEIDFLVKGARDEVHIFECKINPDKFNPKAMLRFRSYYPLGKNICISPHIKTPYRLIFENAEIVFTSDI